MICSSIGNPNSCTLFEINIPREPMHLLFERECVLRICASEGPRRVYAIASLHFFDALANRFNDCGAIRSRSVGQRWLQGIGASAHVGVIGIDPGRVNADQHLAGCAAGCAQPCRPQSVQSNSKAADEKADGFALSPQNGAMCPVVTASLGSLNRR